MPEYFRGIFNLKSPHVVSAVEEVNYWMIIIWKANYEGENLNADLEKLAQINATIQAKIGGQIEGPYLPQDASLLYIFHVEKYEWLNQAGRLWMTEVDKAELPVTPLTYEVAVTPKEFFG